MVLVYRMLVLVGLLEYKLFKSTNRYSYLSFRQLYGRTKGRFNRKLSARISNQRPHLPSELPLESQLGRFEAGELGLICGQIEKEGYYVFPQKWPLADCAAMVEFARQTPANTVPADPTHPRALFDSKAPLAPMYKFEESDLLANPKTRAFLLDPLFLELAGRYLKSTPINDLLVMWWSAPFGNQPSSKAAQMFHFDMDHPRFIKFFVYLTDVGEQNGAHCYLRGSHWERDSSLYADRRFSDQEVLAHHSPEDLIEITGPQGTVIAVDTSGIHKGKMVERGERLILQLEYTNTLFGQKIDRYAAGTTSKFSEQEQAFIAQHADSFERLGKQK